MRVRPLRPVYRLLEDVDRRPAVPLALARLRAGLDSSSGPHTLPRPTGLSGRDPGPDFPLQAEVSFGLPTMSRSQGSVYHHPAGVLEELTLSTNQPSLPVCVMRAVRCSLAARSLGVP
jgi:hypothetical protein